LPPVGRNFLECAQDRCFDLLWHARSRGADASRLLRDDAGDDRARRVPHVRRIAREHLVDDGAQRVDIAPLVDEAVAGRLLGRHVLWCP
jgi:hypothetical protein